MKKRMFAGLLVLAMMFSLAACGGGGDKSSSAKPTTGGDKDAEQYVNTYFESDPTTLDPSLRSDSYSNEIQLNVLEGLIRTEQRDGKYEFMPGDAESWDISEDGTVYTFHIGEDRKWSDGEPVTADQYVYSLQRTADPATGSPSTNFLAPVLNADAVLSGEKPVEELGVKAVDEHTLEITLTQAMPTFLDSIDGSIYYPQRQDIVEKCGDQYGTDADQFVYNGPFKLTEWTHNSSLVLEKNENYWDADSVYLDKVTYQILSDTSAITNAYESGQLDIIQAASAEEKAKYETDGSSVYTKISGGTDSFQFYNTKDPIFSNQKIRQAFSLAVDQAEINDMAFDGLRDPIYGWVPTGITVGDKNFREAAGDPLKDMASDLEADGKTAKDLLIEGMEELGLGDDPSTLDVTYSLAGTGDWYHTFGEYMQQAYKETLGVELEISFNEWSIFEENLTNGNFQIGFMAWGAYYNDPYDMLSLHMSDYNMVYTGWANSEYDELVTAGSREQDDEKRLQDYIDAEKILMEEVPVCPFATSVGHQFTKPYLHDEYAEYGEDQLFFQKTGWKHVYTSGR